MRRFALLWGRRGEKGCDVTIRVAAVQLCSGSDPASNVKTALALVDAAADEGASYVQLPEYFNYLGPKRNFDQVSESIPGPTTEVFGALARARGITIHLGSMLESAPQGARCFNTSVLLAPSGEILATYRKAHLFDIDVPGDIVERESQAIAPGDELVVAPLDGSTLGLSICFDLRFPEMYRQLALRGAQILCVPSAFNASTGRAHWEVLLRARAIENHAFVVAAAQVGTTSEGIATYGHSLIVGPWGEVLAQSETSREDVIVATLNLDDVAQRRQQIAVLELRRPELYRTAPAGSEETR